MKIHNHTVLDELDLLALVRQAYMSKIMDYTHTPHSFFIGSPHFITINIIRDDVYVLPGKEIFAI